MIMKLRLYMYKSIESLTLFIFQRYFFRVQNLFFETILKKHGYNNHRNMTDSGENFFIEKILVPEDPKICIDVGANIGDFSEKLLLKTQSKVIAFEPLLLEYNSLVKRLEHFGERFVPVNMGLGSKVGEDFIFFNPEDTGLASYLAELNQINYLKNEYKQSVFTTTLDKFVEESKIEFIDMIKIDVEGYEKEVLQGAMRTINFFRPKYIQIEMNWHQLFRGTSLLYFAEILSEYRVFQLIKNGWIERDPKTPLSNLYLYSNFIFVRN